MDLDHNKYMAQALDLARSALADGEFPVGCILVARGRVVAAGRRQGTRQAVPSELDHAEMIALRQWERSGKAGNGGPVALYSTLEPCLMCYGASLISGITSVVYAYEDAMGGGCGCNRDRLPTLYRDSTIEILSGIGRVESLALFKAFFKDPNVGYWRDSHLARYTLGQ
jgi:tRNA(adenine34) deaminase